MPKLTIIAGCNGSGKSTTARSFLPLNVPSFDYDKRFLSHYNSMPDSDFREKMAKNITTKEFENAIADAIRSKRDFCYETNFDSYPIFWAAKFKAAGFKLNLIFFCLENQEIARHRIQVRTENKGHFVNDRTVDFKWKEGYKNINLHFGFFDHLLIVENSVNKQPYTNLVQMDENSVDMMTEVLPDYFERRLPAIFKLIQERLGNENG